jgi:hypothetical protein
LTQKWPSAEATIVVSTVQQQALRMNDPPSILCCNPAASRIFSISMSPTLYLKRPGCNKELTQQWPSAEATIVVLTFPCYFCERERDGAGGVITIS